MRPLCWNQSQITDASHLFVFCNKVDIKDEDVDDLINLKARTNSVELEKFSGYGDFIKGNSGN